MSITTVLQGSEEVVMLFLWAPDILALQLTAKANSRFDDPFRLQVILWMLSYCMPRHMEFLLNPLKSLKKIP